MSLDQLNEHLTIGALKAAMQYAKSRGCLHHKKFDSEGDGTIRRVVLHINDDGTSYIVLHGTLFVGAEMTPAAE